MNQPTQNLLTIPKVIAIFKKRWKIVIAAGVIGAAFAITFQLLAPKKFESHAKLLVMKKDPRLAAKGLGPEGHGDSEVRITEEVLATHMQILQSRSIVESALRDAELSALPSITKHMSATQTPADYVLENMILTRGGSGQARTAHVLNVAMRSSSKEDAETILRAVIKSYQSFLSAKFQDVNEEAASLINHAQKELAADLDNAEKKYEQFRQNSSHLMWKPVGGGTQTTNIHRVRYDGILDELASLQLSHAETSARVDAVTARLAGRDLKDVSDVEKLALVDEKNLTRIGLLLSSQRSGAESPEFLAEQPIRLAHAEAEYSSLLSMRMKEKALLTELGPKHPDVIGMQKQIQSFEKFTNEQELSSGPKAQSLDPSALFDAYQQLLKNDLVAMERREERLKAAAEEAKTLASEMVTDELQGETLRRDVERQQVLFNAVVDRLRDINIAKDYGGFINEVLAEPELGLKIAPRLVISLAMGMFFSIVLCVVSVGVAEFRDRRFRSIEDMRRTLQMPVIGRISRIRKEVDSRNSLFRKRTGGDLSRSSQILDPEARAADAFRMLRTSLLFGDGDERRQILCVTSPNPGEGKSTITGNLAVSLAQLGRRVLVVDCDLRNPTQHELFAVPNETGLTTIIKGDLDPTDLIQPTSHMNVSLLARGEAVSNPAEFLATGEFSRLLDSLREKFDHILLDCPPVLPVVEALTTATMADGVVFVVHMERTTQLQAHAACFSLRQAGAELDGVVINGFKPGALGEDTLGNYDSKYGAASEYTTHKVANHDSPRGTGEAAFGRSRLPLKFHRNGNNTTH